MARTSLSLLAACKTALCRTTIAAAFAACALSGSWLLAQLPTTQLNSVFPPGGKQGSEFEVTITGTDLDDASKLIFSHEGITAEPKMTEKTEFDMQAKAVPNRFVVKIAGDVPLGVYEARAVGRFGVSNPRGFAVGNLEELEDDGSNKKFDAAKEIALGSVVNGRIDASSVDYYKVSLKKGERMIVDCLADRIDSRMDATLILYDAKGNEITRNRDTMFADALIDFTAPGDGEYVLGVFDFIYTGGADYFYRLAVHTRPYVDFVFPPAGLPGSNEKYTVYGRNLPGSEPAEGVSLDGNPLEKVSANIALPGEDRSTKLEVGALAKPRSALVDGYEYRYPNANSVRISYARAKVVVEQEPNNENAKAQSIAVPCEFVGQFYPARDNDWVQFEAKAGESYSVEVISHRIGLVASDPYLMIERVTKNDKGEETVAMVAQVDDPSNRNTLIGTDFDTSTDDPSYQLSVTQDATYRIMVRDQFGSNSDPRNVYRLLIRPSEPDFRIVALPEPGTTTNANQVLMSSPVIRKGGTTIIELNVDRRDGFDGEIEVSVEGLPAGVTCSGAIIGGEIERAALVLAAAENADSWAGPIQIVGKANINGKDAIRYARSGSLIWPTTNRQSILPEFRLTRDIAISVTDIETAPALVQAGEDTVYETSLGGKLEVPIKIARRGEFKLDVKLTATGLPADFKPKEVTIKGAASDGKLELDITNTKIKPGSYTFYLQGTAAKYKYARNPEAIAEAEAEQKFIDELSKKLADELKKATADKNEAKIKELQDKVKQADAKKKAADKQVADLKKANAAKDINLYLASTPIKLRIAETPVKLDAKAAGALKQGEKAELSIAVEKLYGFDDKLDITLEAPKGVSGLSPGKLSIDKGKTDGKIELTAAANATPGEHTFTVRARGKFNNVNVESTQEVVVKVEKVEPPAKE